MWGKFPQLGYYDHPAFVSWLWSLGNWLGFSGVWAKFPAILFFHLCLGFFALQWKNLFKSFPLVLGFLVLMAHPFGGIGGILLTPDLPLMCFWFLSFALLSKIIRQLSQSPSQNSVDGNRLLILSCLLGLSLGLGFTSKYMMVLFGAFLLFWYFSLYFYDRAFFRKIPLRALILIIIFGALGSLPTLWWNSQNDWISFSFQMDHGFNSPSFDWRWPVDYLLGSLILSAPFIFFLTSPRRLIQNYPDQKHILIFSFLCAIGPFLFFTKSSLHAHVELNWPAMAYPFVILLAVTQGGPRPLFRNYAILLAVLTVSALVFINAKPSLVPGKVFKEMVLLRERATYAKKLSPFWTCDYQSASIFSFYSDTRVYKIPGCSRFDFYDTREDFEIPQDISMFYFYHHDEQRLPKRFNVKTERVVETFPEGWAIKEVELVR